MGDEISRRTLLKLGIAAGAGLSGLSLLRGLKKPPPIKGLHPCSLGNGLVVSHGQNPAAMTRAAVKALGGMEKLVSSGDVVVIKPNIAWDRPPELAANTNPDVVAELVRMCLDSGASRVKVFDHTCSPNPGPSYERSGIAAAARAAGAQVSFVDPTRFREVAIPNGRSLKSWSFYEEVLYADVLINVPIAKHHSTSKLTMALKNVFGMIGNDRGRLHRNIHANIADLNRVVKVDLTVLDAFRILKDHGPTGGRLIDVDNSVDRARRIVVSRDPVAVDAYGATLFGMNPDEVGFIREAYEAGLGQIDFRINGFEELTVS